MDFRAWFEVNWFTLLQSLGIVGGLLFTAASLQIDARVRRVQNLIDLTHQHREIWTQFYNQPELDRLLTAPAQFDPETITVNEQLFVNLVVLHLNTVHEAIRHGSLKEPEGMRKDIEEFFNFPIPKAVWQRLKPMQNRDLARFVDEFIHY